MLGLNSKQELPEILLVDDDLVSREVMATMLTLGGCTVHSATGGAEAVQMLAGGECKPEVILMDMQMPGLSGVKLIEQLRTQTAAAIVAISASKPPEEIEAAADGFLLKPFGARELQKLLAEYAVKNQAISPEAQPEVPVVSLETLALLRGMMHEAAMRKIFETIVADLDKRTAALEFAVARGDAAEARRIGHAIKGGCGMAGALQAAQLGARIEAGALDAEAGRRGINQLDNSAGVLVDLRSAARNLERMLETGFPA